MTDQMIITEPASHNEAAGPSALPRGQHVPAGWVSASHADQAQRQAMRVLILQEREEAARVELEAEIDKRLNAARSPQDQPVAVQEAPVAEAKPAVTR